MTDQQKLDEFEREVQAMFARRVADVGDAPEIRLPDPDRTRTSATSDKSGTLIRQLSIAAAVVALVATVGGSAVAINNARSHDKSAVPVNTGSPSPATSTTAHVPSKACVRPTPPTWQAAIDAGALRLDQPANSVISADPTSGDMLLLQGNPSTDGSNKVFTSSEIAVFDRAGHGLTIWDSEQAKPAELAGAAASGAISDRWIVFGLRYPQNLGGPHTLLVYDRVSRQTGVLSQLTDAQLQAGKSTRSMPVLVGDSAYWLEGRWQQPSKTSLVSKDLSSGKTTTRSAPGVVDILATSNGLVLVTTPGGVLHIGSGPGLTVSPEVARAFIGAQSYSAMSGTIAWETVIGGRHSYYEWRAGEAIAQRWTITAPGSQPLMSVGFPLHPAMIDGPAIHADGVIDLRTGATVRLPAGVSVNTWPGVGAVFASGGTKAGASGLSRVAFEDLPVISC